MKRARCARIGAISCALLAAACAVDEAREVAQYRSLLDAGRSGGPPADPVAGAVLDVRGALQLANARNESLGIAGEDYVRALIDRRRAAAAFLPSVSLSPSYFVNDTSGGVNNGLDVPVIGSLDVNPKSDPANVERAKSEIASRRARLFDTQDSLLIDVARTMFEVLRAQSSARVLASSLAVQEARVDDARARRDVGFARPIDVSLIEAEAADTRVELVEAQRLSITGTSLLEFLTGAPLEGVVLDGTLEMPEPPPVEEWLAQARKQRQDLVAAEASVEAAMHAVEVASGQWWPSLSVDLAAFLSRDSSPTDRDWSALIGLHLPLFSAGRIRADVRDALSFLREAKLASSLTERAVRRDVEVAFENLRASRERVERLQVRLAAATEAFAQADGLYDAGLGTNLERLIAQDQMIASQLAHESAKLDVQIFYLNLVRSAGGLSAWIGLERPDPDVKTAEEDARAEAR